MCLTRCRRFPFPPHHSLAGRTQKSTPIPRVRERFNRWRRLDRRAESGGEMVELAGLASSLENGEAAKPRSWRFDDRSDLGHILFEIFFDPKLERHAARRAPLARFEESDLDDAVRVDRDQLDVPAVTLDGRPDEVEHCEDALAQIAVRIVAACSFAHVLS